MLAYTNRFLALANRIRSLHDKYKDDEKKQIIHGQIKSMRYRLRLIRNMQFFGVVSFLFCIICMYLIYINTLTAAHVSFAAAMIAFTISLLLSLLEIIQSNKALELELSDMEGLEDPSIVDYIRKKFDMDKPDKDDNKT